MTELMLFSGWHGWAIFGCSVVICLCYQVIPSALTVIEDNATDGKHDATFLARVTSSAAFRAFIRFCGANHILMSGVMLAVGQAWIVVTPFWQKLLLFGEASVALVSFVTALTVWRVKWYLQKQ